MSERMTAVEAQAELDAEDRRPSFVRPSEIRALREVVELTRERDEARARIARYVAAKNALSEHTHAQPVTRGHWCDECRRLVGDRAVALAVLCGERETPAGEGERC